MSKLGRLKKVELRDIWTGEATDFTPWLAKENNLKLLGDTIGIELEFHQIEKDVGLFRADILCKNTIDSSWILIENQLERTDHNHLGQLLTYAAGLDAVTIIWIASRFTEEHRAALDWLNEITDEKFNFFGLEIELWQIGNSEVAPKFNVISKPNDWTKTVHEIARKSSGNITEYKSKQLEFWMAFKDFMDNSQSFIRCQKPRPQHWTIHAIGRTGFYLTSVLSSWNSVTGEKDSEIRAEVVMHGENAKESFAQLEEYKNEIETELGETLNWHNPNDAKACKVFLRHSSDFLDKQKWEDQHEWLKSKLEKLHTVFAKRIKNL